MEALQKRHHASAQSLQHQLGKVRIWSRKVYCISGGAMKIMATTCSKQYSRTIMLFEPLDSGLPAGWLASPSLVRVNRGTAYILVINVGSTKVLL